jgi:hypothetical protein
MKVVGSLEEAARIPSFVKTSLYQKFMRVSEMGDRREKLGIS